MKIIHISTNDIAGGAARAAYRLHTGLLRLGHDSTMLVKHKLSNDPHVQVFQSGWSCWRRLLGFMRARRLARELGRVGGAGLFSDDRSRFRDAVARAVPVCDIVHLHWASLDFLDVGSFLSVMSERGIPVVWTLHDVWPATGGCHYTGGCARFDSGCGNCPQRGSTDPDDLSARIFRRKQQAVGAFLDKSGCLRVVGNSQWTGRQAAASGILGVCPVSVIHYGLDADVFRPVAGSGMRETLGISADAPVVLFVAENVADQRKGMAHLVKALQRVRQVCPNVRLVCAGRMADSHHFEGLPVVQVGSIDNDHLLALLFSSADVFVIPSVEEAFGLTALESMACGTPVVGFDTGGIPDMVRPGKTGLLAPVGDVDALAKAIQTIIEDDALRQRMAAECRETVLREFTLERQATAYVGLYGGLVKG
jgi:glycosyltransferase involved in cell wall biosynthesis